MSSSPSVLDPAGGLGCLNDVLHPTGRPGRKPAQGSTMVRGRRRRGGRRRRAVYALRASCPVPTCRPRAGSRLTPGLLAPYFSAGAACCLQGRSKAGLGQTRLEYTGPRVTSRGGLPSCEPRGPQGSFTREPPDVPSSGRARGRRAPSGLHRLCANVPSSLSLSARGCTVSKRCALQSCALRMGA